MSFIEIIILTLAAIWALLSGFQLRIKAKSSQAVEHTSEVQSFLAVLSVILIPILSISPFHLLWLLPSTIVFGLASVFFPFKLLWSPASWYASIWYIGAHDDCRAFYKSGDYEQAMHCYRERIKNNPKSGENHFYLGLAYDKLGLKLEAIDAYKEATRLSPKESNVFLNLGIAYKNSGNIPLAIDAYESALHINNNYPKAIYQLGILYAENGNREKALGLCEKLRQTNPTKADELLKAINK